jgi:hypothetical protein
VNRAREAGRSPQRCCSHKGRDVDHSVLLLVETGQVPLGRTGASGEISVIEERKDRGEGEVSESCPIIGE